MRKLIAATWLTLALVALVGAGTAAAAPARQGGALPPEVANTAWELVSLQPAGAAAEDVTGGGITMSFGAENAVSGSGGCNNYRSTYTVGAAQALSFAPAAATLRLCEEPASRREQAFFVILSEVSAYSLAGGQLTLTTDAGGTLVFAAAAGGATAPSTLPSTGAGDAAPLWLALAAALAAGAGLYLRRSGQGRAGA